MNPWNIKLCVNEVNAPSCNPDELDALIRFSARPPERLTLCKYGSRSVVGMIPVAGSMAVLKYYYPRTWLKRITYGLTGSRGLRSWRAGLELSRIGVTTAEPLVFMEWRSFGGMLLDRSFLATRHVAGVELKAFVAANESNAAGLSKVADNLRKVFGLMARHRIVHGDLKATNILVGDDHGVTFIDLDAVTLNVAPARWAELRARDVELFFGNWKPGSPVREYFSDVFQDV